MQTLTADWQDLYNRSFAAQTVAPVNVAEPIDLSENIQAKAFPIEWILLVFGVGLLAVALIMQHNAMIKHKEEKTF